MARTKRQSTGFAPGSVEDLRARKAQEEQEQEYPQEPAQTLDGFLDEMFSAPEEEPQEGMPSMGRLKQYFKTKSAIIRWLHLQDFTILQIHKHTGWRYQHIRNVVTSEPKRGTNEQYRHITLDQVLKSPPTPIVGKEPPEEAGETDEG